MLPYNPITRHPLLYNLFGSGATSCAFYSKVLAGREFKIFQVQICKITYISCIEIKRFFLMISCVYPVNINSPFEDAEQFEVNKWRSSFFEKNTCHQEHVSSRTRTIKNTCHQEHVSSRTFISWRNLKDFFGSHKPVASFISLADTVSTSLKCHMCTLI